MAQGDQNSARALAAVQQELLPLPEVGRKLQAQPAEMQEAVASLQQAGQGGLTREKLLGLLIDAPNETRLAALVSMARSGLDYEFLRILTERVDQAQGEEKEKLTELRERIIQLTQEIDQRMQEQLKSSRELLNKILQAENIEQAAEESLSGMDDFFAEALRVELQNARQANDLAKLGKLQKVVGVIQKASAPPPEIALAEELLGVESEEERRGVMEAHASEITPEFLQVLTSLMGQLEQQGDQPELAQRLQEVYRAALRFSMQANLKK
jgi:uncharacterized phage infection (PIP) family protein YhgE